MHNYWLKKKDIKAKFVEWKFKEGKSQVFVELQCGRKFRCEARSDLNNGTPILTTWFESYDDERFYEKVPCKQSHTVNGHQIMFDYKCKEPFDIATFQARYDVVEKIGLSILLSTGELRYEDYKDMHDYYANVDVGLPGYELPKVEVRQAKKWADDDFYARMQMKNYVI